MASNKFVPPSRPTHSPSAPYSVAPIRFAPRNSVPSKFVSRRSACTKEAPRRFASERSAPRRFALFSCAPCRLTPVKSAFARFTPLKSALAPDSPPDSAQILCWSSTSARSSSEIPRGSALGAVSGDNVCIFEAVSKSAPAFLFIRAVTDPQVQLPNRECNQQIAQNRDIIFGLQRAGQILCRTATSPTKCGLGAPDRLTQRYRVIPVSAQCSARLSTAMVYQHGCGNRLLRGTRRPTGNVQPETRKATEEKVGPRRRIGGGKNFEEKDLEKKQPGSPLRGRGSPAYPARLRSERARNLKRQASQKLENACQSPGTAMENHAGKTRFCQKKRRRSYCFSSSQRRNS